MRIISWNANGKFREKFPFILNEDADIYVIQECENPEISNSDEYIEFASNYYGLVKTSIMVLEYLLKIMLN